MSQKTQITVSGILDDLKNGMTRTSKSKHFDPEKGCIQDKYGLSTSDLKRLFDHPKLKGRKTILEKETSFTLIDDTTSDKDMDDNREPANGQGYEDGQYHDDVANHVPNDVTSWS